MLSILTLRWYCSKKIGTTLNGVIGAVVRTGWSTPKQQIPKMSTDEAKAGHGEKEKVGSVETRTEKVDTGWEKLVDHNRLSAKELEIHRCHTEALQNRQESYIDPSTGYQVLTRLAHLTRGECCGNACRHCPYGHANVPEEVKRTKVFNSAFYK